MKQFYTYIHKKASDGSVFYVGKGTGLRAWKPQDRSDWWKKTSDKHGFSVEICAEWKTEQEAFDHERFLIWCFKDMGVQLVNLTDGGDGASGYRHTNETRVLLSERQKSYANDPSNKEKISLIRKNQWSQKSKTKASESSRKYWTEDAKLRHSKILSEAYSSEDMKKMQREKSPIVNRRNEFEETRRLAAKNYWSSEKASSEEAKKKRSEARKASWVTRRKNASN